MAELSVIVPALDLSERARAAVGERDAEVTVAPAGFPELQAALRATETPIVVVVADRDDPLELIPELVGKLEASPDLDVVLAARPRGTWRARLAQLVATRPPAPGANGTSAMRRPLADRVAAVKIARADLPALFAGLDARSAVIRDARVRPPTTRPSLLLTGAAAQWIALGAVLLYLLGLLSFGVLPPGVARVTNVVMLVLCALAACVGVVVHVRARRAVGGPPIKPA